jgi:nickel/cobalt transporter (NicO) family protein
MNRFRVLQFISSCFFVVLPVNAFAHLVNADVGVFYAGMLHPLTSIEHLFPTLALALIASQTSKQAGRILIFLFPVTLIIGLLIGNRFTTFEMAHPANLLTLVLLGGLLIIAKRINMSTVITATLVTGLILGYRSGIDMSDANADLKFIPGVALTGFIAIVLISAWVPAASNRMGNTLLAVGGVFFIVAGLYLIGQLVSAGNTAIVRNIGLPTEESLIALVKNRELTLPVIIGSLLAAAAWGAAHSLTPGHGKAIVAAYLVGARSTPWHAFYLGLTVTITHTLGVFLLGLVTLFASRYILAEQLYPILGVLSGMIIIVLAASMLVNRIRPLLPSKEHAHTHHHHEHHHTHDHGDHDHSHHHHGDHGHSHHHHLPPGADGSPVTWRSLLGLGISGGLLPCPSALVLLLAAVSFERVGFGILLVTAFSIGMAAVLMAVGLLFVKGSRLISGTTQVAWFSKYLPIGSALLILFLGLVLTFDSFMKMGG